MNLIDEATASGPGDRERIRSRIASAGPDPGLDRELCGELAKAREIDHSRALVILSILGERRTDVAAGCLGDLLARPLPERGTVVEGEIQERIALVTLQAKAVVGLAYRGTARTDGAVLALAEEHPSPIVRRSAAEAYLWNHRNRLAAARATLAKHLRPEESDLAARPIAADLRPW